MSEQIPSDLPEPVIRRRRRLDPSLVWLVPVIAILVGVVLVVRAYQSAGPEITITFLTAEGLEKGTTEVKFKNVVVGKVRDIQLAPERDHVIVSVGLTKDAKTMAVTDSRFWVVRPRADLGGISGFTTIFSGSYIGVDVGTSTEDQLEFKGLEVPPAITSDQRGKRFLLTSEDLGSLSIGSPVYYHRIPVGRIGAYRLAPNGKSVDLEAFIDAPYDQYVTERTHFWNASGVNVTLDAAGLKLNTQSLATMLTGGIAFQELEGPEPAKVASSDTQFKLYEDQGAAMAPPDGDSMRVRLRFMQSIRGLSVDAPLDFKGIQLGRVTSVGLDFNQAKKRFAANVIAEIYPSRLGASYEKYRNAEGRGKQSPEEVLSHMIQRGLRAKLASGSLLTGQMFIALDFVPKAPPAEVDMNERPLEIPTIAGGLDQIQERIASIADKLDKLPLEDIGNNLRDTLKDADELMKQLNTQLLPEAKETLKSVQGTLDSVNGSLDSPDGGLGQDLHGTLEEVQRAARSLRNLGDYLQRHPETLLQGKPEAEAPKSSK